MVTYTIGVEFRITGTAGHGSRLLENTAGEKLQRLLAKYVEFRNQELQKLNGIGQLTIGDVTTVNLTVLNGGQQLNVVPSTIVAKFDIRVAADLPFSDMDKEVRVIYMKYLS